MVPALRKGFFRPHPRQFNEWCSSTKDPPTRQPNACGSSTLNQFLLPPRQSIACGSSITKRVLPSSSSSNERLRFQFRDPPTRQPNACGSSIREGFLPAFKSMRVGPVLRTGFFLPHPRQIDAWGSSTRDPPTRQPNACDSSFREEFLLPRRQLITCGSSTTKRFSFLILVKSARGVPVLRIPSPVNPTRVIPVFREEFLLPPQLNACGSSITKKRVPPSSCSSDIRVWLQHPQSHPLAER